MDCFLRRIIKVSYLLTYPNDQRKKCYFLSNCSGIQTHSCLICKWTQLFCQIVFYLEHSPSPPNCSKDYWKLLPSLLSIIWPGLVTSWVVFQKIYSKMYLVSCTNTHHDVADSVNHGMVKNTKTLISWERNITYLLSNNKKINLCFRRQILRSYLFVAEVTFTLTLRKTLFLGWLLKKSHIQIKHLYGY